MPVNCISARFFAVYFTELSSNIPAISPISAMKKLKQNNGII